MKKIVYGFLIILICLFLIGCEDENPDTKDDIPLNMEEYLVGLEQRKNQVLEIVKTYWGRTSCYFSKDGFAIANATFYMYEQTNDELYLEKALAQSKLAFEKLSRDGDCFGIYYGIDHYIRYKKYYSDPELKEKYENILITSKAYSDLPHTPNHSLMCAVARYLASEIFPDEDIANFYGDYSNRSDDYTGKKTIIERLKNYPSYGEYEFNSETYFYCHFMPLRSIAELAQDEEMANMAKLVTENMMMSIAPVWLDGLMMTGTCRSYNPFSAQAELGCGSMIFWYFFGGIDLTDKQIIDSEGLFLSSVIASGYIPNWMTIMMAQDRDEAYTHYEMHSFRQENWDASFIACLKTYMNKTYGVFSLKNLLYPQGNYEKLFAGFYKQQFDWGVRWKTENPSDKSTFTIQHVQSPIVNVKAFGTSPYQQTLQNQSTVIGVYDIPESYEYPNVYISQPNCYKAMIDESYLGRVYLHYGDVIIAYAMSTPFTAANIENQIITINNIRKGYFICETFEASAIDGETYEEQLWYVQSLFEGTIRTVTFDKTSNSKLKYTAVNGDELEIEYGGNDKLSNGKINGTSVSYTNKDYPVQSNPWVNQKWSDTIVTYTYGNHSIIFDFDKWTMEEKVN